MTVSSSAPVRTPPPPARPETNYKKVREDAANLAESLRAGDHERTAQSEAALQKDEPSPKPTPSDSSAERVASQRETARTSHAERAYSHRPTAKGSRLNIRA